MEQLIDQWLFDPTVGKIIAALFGIIAVVVFVRVAQRLLARYIRDTGARYKARKSVVFVGYFLGILVITVVFSEKLGNLTVALGVAGAGIAFALQEVIASVAGWFAITIAHFYKTGDRVQLGGIKGDVIDIGILRTTLMEIGGWIKGDIYNGRVVRVANSFVFKEPVFNYSGDFPFLWDEIEIPIKYGSDYRMARELLQQIAEEIVGEYAAHAQKSWDKLVQAYRIEDARVQPMVTMTADENWVTFTIRYVVDFKKRRTTKDLLYGRILEAVQMSRGKFQIASASMDINLSRRESGTSREGN